MSGHPHTVAHRYVIVRNPDTGASEEKVFADWSVECEAKFFLDLIRRDQTTLQRAKIDILMTKHQFDWLVSKNCAPVYILKDIRLRRAQTWERLKELFLKAEKGGTIH